MESLPTKAREIHSNPISSSKGMSDLTIFEPKIKKYFSFSDEEYSQFVVVDKLGALLLLTPSPETNFTKYPKLMKFRSIIIDTEGGEINLVAEFSNFERDVRVVSPLTLTEDGGIEGQFTNSQKHSDLLPEEIKTVTFDKSFKIYSGKEVAYLRIFKHKGVIYFSTNSKIDGRKSRWAPTHLTFFDVFLLFFPQEKIDALFEGIDNQYNPYCYYFILQSPVSTLCSSINECRLFYHKSRSYWGQRHPKYALPEDHTLSDEEFEAKYFHPPTITFINGSDFDQNKPQFIERKVKIPITGSSEEGPSQSEETSNQSEEEGDKFITRTKLESPEIENQILLEDLPITVDLANKLLMPHRFAKRMTIDLHEIPEDASEEETFRIQNLNQELVNNYNQLYREGQMRIEYVDGVPTEVHFAPYHDWMEPYFEADSRTVPGDFVYVHSEKKGLTYRLVTHKYYYANSIMENEANLYRRFCNTFIKLINDESVVETLPVVPVHGRAPSREAFENYTLVVWTTIFNFMSGVYYSERTAEFHDNFYFQDYPALLKFIETKHKLLVENRDLLTRTVNGYQVLKPAIYNILVSTYDKANKKFNEEKAKLISSIRSEQDEGRKQDLINQLETYTIKDEISNQIIESEPDNFYTLLISPRDFDRKFERAKKLAEANPNLTVQIKAKGYKQPSQNQGSRSQDYPSSSQGSQGRRNYPNQKRAEQAEKPKTRAPSQPLPNKESYKEFPNLSSSSKPKSSGPKGK